MQFNGIFLKYKYFFAIFRINQETESPRIENADPEQYIDDDSLSP